MLSVCCASCSCVALCVACVERQHACLFGVIYSLARALLHVFSHLSWVCLM